MGLGPRQRAGEGLDDGSGRDHLGDGFGEEIGNGHFVGGLRSGEDGHGGEDEKDEQSAGATQPPVLQHPLETDSEHREQRDRRVEDEAHRQDIVEDVDRFDEGERTGFDEYPTAEEDRRA